MIQIEKLQFSVGRFELRDIDVHVRAGEYFVLLGPSGSGKTMLVECLCGLNRLHAGRIILDGQDVTRLQPRERHIGYVPQDYALFPHKTVAENIGFGLEHDRLLKRTFGFPLRVGGRALERFAGVPPVLAGQQHIDALAEMVGVTHLSDRLPERLSGGEKQRVALARALAVKPKVLLLDEPVSALDERTRDDLCRRLKRLQRDTGATMIHVCHNFAEMLAVADRVGIIHQGQIVQIGTPSEVLQRPINPMVAEFVRAGNLFPAKATRVPTAERSLLRVTRDDGVSLLGHCPDAWKQGESATVMVRPENIRVSIAHPRDVSPEQAVIEGTVDEIIDLGPVVQIHVIHGRQNESPQPERPRSAWLVSLGKTEYNDCQIGVGSRLFLVIAAEDVHVMPGDQVTALPAG